MIRAGLELARRLENADALNGAALAAEVEWVAGGAAIFAGAGSPLTHAVGLGMHGPVAAEELDRLEAFYRARAAPLSVDVCPLADPTLVELLGRRGYRVTEFNQVLVRPLAAVEIAPADMLVRLASAEEQDLWARTVARGFLEHDHLTPEEMDVGRAIFRMAGALCYLAFQGTEPAAAGAMAMHGGLATLFADSTIPRFRRAGLHAVLIRERLREAGARGCDLATASAAPGTISQRNFERHGFQVVYTKVALMR